MNKNIEKMEQQSGKIFRNKHLGQNFEADFGKKLEKQKIFKIEIWK